MIRWLLLGTLTLNACADAADVGGEGDAVPADARPGDRFVLPVVDMAVLPDGGLKEALEPCVNGAECLSGYCLQFEDGTVCTKLCVGGDCPDGWSCKSVVNAGVDVVFICVPDRDTLCAACENNTDCGEFGDMCVNIED